MGQVGTPSHRATMSMDTQCPHILHGLCSYSSVAMVVQEPYVHDAK